jgi:hypothetical protein
MEVEVGVRWFAASIQHLTPDMEACSRISKIDKRIITFLLQGNSSFLLYLNPVPLTLNPFIRCRIEILPQPSMSISGDYPAYSVPFVDGTPFIFGWISAAARSALPNPLKIASKIW